MGPMRFPISLTFDNETVDINDHKMVFQLADVLNEMNGNSSQYMVKFIKYVLRISLPSQFLTDYQVDSKQLQRAKDYDY